MYNILHQRFLSPYCAACSGLGVRFHRISQKQMEQQDHTLFVVIIHIALIDMGLVDLGGFSIPIAHHRIGF